MITEELKKEIYNKLTFKDKQDLIIFLLELIKEDYEDLKDYEG